MNRSSVLRVLYDFATNPSPGLSFYAPGSNDRGHIAFVLSVCLFVCLSACLLSTLTFVITFDP